MGKRIGEQVLCLPASLKFNLKQKKNISNPTGRRMSIYDINQIFPSVRIYFNSEKDFSLPILESIDSHTQLKDLYTFYLNMKPDFKLFVANHNCSSN